MLWLCDATPPPATRKPAGTCTPPRLAVRVVFSALACSRCVPYASVFSNLYASSLWTADVNLKRPLFSLARFLCHARMWVHVVRLDAESGCVCVLRCLYKFPLVNRAKGKQRRQDSDEESDSDIPKAPRGANEWDT